MWLNECSFLQRTLNIFLSGVVAAVFGSYMAGVTQNYCHLGAFCAHHTTMSHHFMQSHMCRVYMCLAVTRHLHFWQNDRTSWHRKLTLDKKILPLHLPGLEPVTFWPQVRRSDHWAIPAPQVFDTSVNVWFMIHDNWLCVYMCRQQQAQPVPNKPHEVSVGIRPSEKQKRAQFWNPGVKSWSCCYYKYWLPTSELRSCVTVEVGDLGSGP